ncbi:hypothetical protein, partial [Pseudomonas aeruginosa]|uniref:hypothetical protein n=1 Tax=Pseudomonas aeruginosa TaxID=287 RepID=UPI003C6E3DB4
RLCRDDFPICGYAAFGVFPEKRILERRTLSVWNKRANPLGFALFSFCLPFEKPESVCRLNIAATFQTASF